MANEFKKSSIIYGGVKASLDLDEIKNQSKIQSEEAKKLRLLQEKMAKEQEKHNERMREDQEEQFELERERSERLEEIEREKIKLEREKNSELINLERQKQETIKRHLSEEKIQKYINEAEEYGLTAYAGKIIYNYYEIYPHSSGIKSIANSLIDLAKEYGLDFLLTEKKLKDVSKNWKNEFLSTSELPSNKVGDITRASLVECIFEKVQGTYEEKNFTKICNKMIEEEKLRIEEEKLRIEDVYKRAIVWVTHRRNFHKDIFRNEMELYNSEMDQIIKKLYIDEYIDDENGPWFSVLKLSENFINSEKEKKRKEKEDEFNKVKSEIRREREYILSEKNDLEKKLIKLKSNLNLEKTRVKKEQIIGILSMPFGALVLWGIWSGENNSDLVLLKIIGSLIFGVGVILLGGVYTFGKDARSENAKDELDKALVRLEECNNEPFLAELTDANWVLFFNEILKLREEGQFKHSVRSSKFVYLKYVRMNENI